MAYLAVVGSKAVNGVAYIHSEIIKETIFKVGPGVVCVFCSASARGMILDIAAHAWECLDVSSAYPRGVTDLQSA